MNTKNTLPILTKTDLVDEGRLEASLTTLRSSNFERAPLPVSLRTGQGLDELRDLIVREFRYPVEIVIHIPPKEVAGPLLHWLYEHTDVLNISEGDEGSTVRLRCRERDLSSIEKRARILSSSQALT